MCCVKLNKCGLFKTGHLFVVSRSKTLTTTKTSTPTTTTKTTKVDTDDEQGYE